MNTHRPAPTMVLVHFQSEKRTTGMLPPIPPSHTMVFLWRAISLPPLPPPTHTPWPSSGMLSPSPLSPPHTHHGPSSGVAPSLPGSFLACCAAIASAVAGRPSTSDFAVMSFLNALVASRTCEVCVCQHGNRVERLYSYRAHKQLGGRKKPLPHVPRPCPLPLSPRPPFASRYC